MKREEDILSPGTIVGERFRISCLLGEGGMGVVYKAQNLSLDHAVALKCLLPDYAQDEKLVARFFQEAKVAARIDHKHIVRVTDILHADGEPVTIVMEYLHGQNLRTVLERQGRLEVRRALHIVDQVCDALGAAHDEGVIHRDLKPENIFLIEKNGEPDFVKVLDFGISKLMDSEQVGTLNYTLPGTVLGTPEYMAPEQLTGQPDRIDHRVDIYGVGVLLFELLTGRRIVEGDSFPELIAAVLRDAPPRLRDVCEDIPPEVDELVALLLSREASNRPDSALVVRQAIEHILAGDFSVKKVSIASDIPTRPGRQKQGITRPRGRVDRSPNPGKASVTSEFDLPTVQYTKKDPAAPVSSPVPTPVPRKSTVITQPLLRRKSGEKLRRSARRVRSNTNLPELADSFVGRGKELAELKDRVESGQRLITLLGAGGTGKTRLSVRFGVTASSMFPGGVCFCDFSEATSRLGLMAAMGKALDIPLTQRDTESHISKVIAERGKALFILDNFERLVGEAGDTVGRWSRETSQAVFLVTSRVGLRVRGESVFDLSPLPAEDAMDLFYDRAQAVQSGFERTDERDAVVKAIVEQLDCLSLAVEMAAARVRVFSVEQIVSRLNKRFSLLKGERRDQSWRQATLRQAIDWSWDLLSSREQATLSQVSVFAGGFRIEAAEAVIHLSGLDDDALIADAVESLVNHSLLIREEVLGSLPRFRLLESVRAYAQEKLGAESQQVQRRHAAFFARYGRWEQLDALFTGKTEMSLERLRLERRNLLAATKFCLSVEDGDQAALCALAATPLFELVGPIEEGTELFEQVCEQSLSPRYRGRLLAQRGFLLGMCERGHEAVPLFEEAILLSDQEQDWDNLAYARAMLQNRLLCQGETERARHYLDAAIELLPKLSPGRVQVYVTRQVGWHLVQCGMREEAVPWLHRSLSISRELGDLMGEGAALLLMGVTLFEEGNYTEAARCQEAAVVAMVATNNRTQVAYAFNNMGLMSRAQDRRDESREYFEQAIEIHRELGFSQGEAISRGNLGTLIYEDGDLEQARAHFEFSIETGDKSWNALAGIFRGSLARVCADEGDFETARKLIEEGHPQIQNWSFEYAKFLCKKGYVAMKEGKIDEAHEALAAAKEIELELGVLPDSELSTEVRSFEALLKEA